MKVLVFILVCSLATLQVLAQRGDSLLLNETRLSRPLNMHRHQFRISGAHLLALSSIQYIGSNRTPSYESGRTRNFSAINLDIKYGITEYLQARFVWNRTSEVIAEPAFFDGFGNEFYVFNTAVKKIGWEDPEWWIDYRLPFFGKRTDVVLNGGASFPWMASGANEPAIRIQPSNLVFEDGSEFQQISTTHDLNTGRGVMRLGYGVQFKQRFKRMAFNFQSTYYLPLGTETVNRWELTNTGFEYVSESYSRQIEDQWTILSGIESQLRPWLNVSLDYFYFRSRHGWNEVEGQKLLVPESRLSQVILGYEIMTSKRLWIGQTLNVTLRGTNVYAPVLLSTTAKFNLFL